MAGRWTARDSSIFACIWNATRIAGAGVFQQNARL